MPSHGHGETWFGCDNEEEANWLADRLNGEDGGHGDIAKVLHLNMDALDKTKAILDQCCKCGDMKRHGDLVRLLIQTYLIAQYEAR